MLHLLHERCSELPHFFAYFSKKYEKLTPQQQVVYLLEAEKVFTAFDKIPDIVWEDEFKKYDEVLKKYKEIKIDRWVSNS